jgi:membrane protein required for beta-lactamase induction
MKFRLTNFHTLLGLSLSLLTILSFIISIQTFIKPNLFWLFVTLFFIIVNIWSWIYMMRSVLKETEPLYKAYKENQENEEMRIKEKMEKYFRK